MKSKLRSFSLLLLFGMLIFASCKKDDTTGSNPSVPIEGNPLFSSIQGKWKVSGITERKQNSQSFVSLKEMGKPQPVSIEFLSDTTYVILMADETVYTGHFNITDSTMIDLSKFGTLTEIKVTTSSMNFKLSFGNNTISVSTNKAAEIPATDNTKLICKNWLLTTQESGQESYDYADSGTERITILFSKAGTYLVQYLGKDTIYSAEADNWKWHSSLPNAFDYWSDDEPEDVGTVNITELSENSLKITENTYDYIYDANDNVTDSTPQTYNYVLTPASLSNGRVATPSSSRRIATGTRQKGIFRKHF